MMPLRWTLRSRFSLLRLAWLLVLMTSGGTAFAQDEVVPESGQAPVAPAVGEDAPVEPIAIDSDNDSDDGDETVQTDENDPHRVEVGALPALNYDSDTGFGFGLIGSVARFSPGYRPYRWRLRFLFYATVRGKPGGGTEFPYHDDNVFFELPGLMDGKLRLQMQTGFRRFTTASYFGLGSASSAEENDDPRFYRYDRIYPFALAYGRYALWDRSTDERARRLEAFAGLYGAYNTINLYDGSKLAQDVDLAGQDTPDGRALDALLHGTEDHALLMPIAGLLYDTRDHETTPAHGTFTELSLRASPGVDAGLSFVGVSLVTRWYQALAGQRLVLAARGIGDMIFGSAPFYELSTVGAFTRTDGPGGSGSVRGVDGQRFHGKAKLIGNLELRSQFLPFSVVGQRFNLGALAFFDAGRVWADFDSTEIAGSALDDGHVAVGVGAGLRLLWGETFIVRVDPGYSPTESTFGLYINVDHIF